MENGNALQHVFRRNIKMQEYSFRELPASVILIILYLNINWG